MYLPKFKYKKAKFSPGTRFTLPNGKRYVGWFFETYDEEFYTGKEPGEDNVLLTAAPLPIPEISALVSISFTPMLAKLLEPSQKDKDKGSFTRFFVQDKNSKKISEVTKEKYKIEIKKPNIQGLELQWSIQQPAEDIVKNGFVYQGSINKNKKAVEQASKDFPNLNTIIKSFDQHINREEPTVSYTTTKEEVQIKGSPKTYLYNNLTGNIRELDS